MKTFLQMVAKDLYNKIGNELSRTAIIFPNKRASLFFNEHLAAQTNCPLWSPTFVSINDLFSHLSTLKSGDSIQLVCELYKVFREATQSKETLDDFYFWGELLISDFNDVDKNMVDATRLFSNLKDLKDIMDTADYLNTEQVEAIKQFFQNFSPDKHTELKMRFINLWDKLGEIYHNYKKRLTELGIAYEGMLYRQALEELDTERLEYDRYVFVGFNVLNEVERRFFQILQDASKAWFYWDYDIYYTRLPRERQPPFKHEAGEFILRNLQLFPNQLSESCFDVMKYPKHVRYISAPTENAQARYLSTLLTEENLKNYDEKENAVVLCNESLLLPVLHTLPPNVKHVNITMGFPLAQTPIYSLINALAEMQTTGYRSDTGCYTYDTVLSVLRHPYIRQLTPQAKVLEQRLMKNNRFYPVPSELKTDEVLNLIFTPQNNIKAFCTYLTERIKDVSALYRDKDKENDTKDIYGQLYQESLFKSYTLINRLKSLIEKGELQDIRIDSLKRLMNRLLTASTIPFHGEPAVGLQVMGVLETRNLDFRNLIMLSLNEGKLPKSGNESSFIPYNLRKAFGMTTIEHKNAVYAYYFYRLIQRAENITLMYNTSSDGLNRGEMSRFMLQYLVESPQEITCEYLEASQSPQTTPNISINKSPEILNRLYNTFDIHKHPDAVLSPSALNAYLDCHLRFYYRYIAGLKQPDEVSADIDSALFGTIFHRAAELMYQELTIHGRVIRKEDLDKLLKDEVKIQSYVDRAFKENFFHIPDKEKPEYNGIQLIHAKVICSYLKQLLRIDQQYAPFTMEGMEQKVQETVEVKTLEGSLYLQIGGTIDRIDSKGDTLRIVDYKTGGMPKIPENIQQLFIPAENRPNYILQTFLYAAILCHKQPKKVAPALLYIHRAASEEYSPVIEMGKRNAKEEITDFRQKANEFWNELHILLREIFDPQAPFTQTEQTKQCEYCDFKRLCRR